MKIEKARVPKAFEKEINEAGKKALERMHGLERRLAAKEILRTEYRQRRDELEDLVVRIGLAMAILKTSTEIEQRLGGLQGILGESRKATLAEILLAKNAQIEKLLGLGKKIFSHRQDFYLTKEIMDIHSEMLETEHGVFGLLEENAKDRLREAQILGSLEEKLQDHKIREMTNEAAISAVDDFIIEPPKSHMAHRHEPPRRESRSRLAKTHKL